MDGRRRSDGQSKFFRLLRLDSAQLFVILARVLLCWDPLRRYLLAPNNPNSLVSSVSFFSVCFASTRTLRTHGTRCSIRHFKCISERQTSCLMKNASYSDSVIIEHALKRLNIDRWEAQHRRPVSCCRAMTLLEIA